MDSVGEGEGGKIWENDIETCKISCKKRVASPGSMHDTGCLGLVHWDGPEGWYPSAASVRRNQTRAAAVSESKPRGAKVPTAGGSQRGASSVPRVVVS